MLSAEDIRSFGRRWTREMAQEEAAYDRKQASKRRARTINMQLVAGLLGPFKPLVALALVGPSHQLYSLNWLPIG